MVGWQPGDQLVMEMTDFGMPFLVLPVTVVDDRDGQLVLWFADGTPYQHRIQRDGSGIPRVASPSAFAQLDTQLAPTTAPGHTAQVVLRPGRAHAVHLHWDMPGWRFRQWYVNLQTPFERTASGIQSTDRFLDIVVEPDLRWHWKDDDELAEAVRVGRLTDAEAAAIRAEGERVVVDIEAGRPPFRHIDTLWRPNPEWNGSPHRNDVAW